MFSKLLREMAVAQGASTMLGSSYGKDRKKKRVIPDDAGASATMTKSDPSRPQVEATPEQIESGQSVAEQKKRRRQRDARGATPFVRGASVLG